MKTPQAAMLGLVGYLLLFVAALFFFLGLKGAQKKSGAARWWTYSAVVSAVAAIVCLYLAL